MQIDPGWERVEADESYTQFKLPDPPMNMYVLVLEASTIDDAFTEAFQIVGFDPDLLTGAASAIIDDWQAYSQEDDAGLSYGLVARSWEKMPMF
jgi:hypothetical protein